MSVATFSEWDQRKISKLWGDGPRFCCLDFYEQIPDLSNVVVAGNPAQSTATCIKQDYQMHPTMNVIQYTNSKKKAEDSLVPSSENILDSLGIGGESMPCTGDSGVG